MSEVIGSGVIEVSADSRKLTAGIDEAKKSLKSLGVAAGDVTKGQSQSIDRYVKSLGVVAVTAGKSGRELELYRLALRGATAEQLKAADSALRMSEGYARGEAVGQRLRTGLIAIGAAATVAAGVLTSMVIGSINAADNLNDLSKKTGVSVEDLSGLSLAAKQSGTDLEGLAASISKLSVNMGKDPEKYRALGVSAKDPIEAFKQLADIFSAVEDPQTRAALGAEALGKSWQSAAPVLAEGSKGIGEMIDKGKKLSGVTQEMADRADKFNDQLEIMKTAAGGLGTQIGNEMLPAMTKITEAIMAAYEESGKLNAAWVALGSIGAFLFTDEFASAQTKIKDLEFNLMVLEERKQNTGLIDQILFGSKNDIIGQIEGVKAKIAELKKSMQPAPAAPKSAPDPKVTQGVAGFIKPPKKGTNTAGQEAKAQLAADLEDIKAFSAKTISAYANGEKTMEALRSAGLVDERAYYESKMAFLRLDSQAQADALQKEIDRLGQEKLSGKDKIDNLRKITETQAKLDKLRADSATSLNILSIQEEAAGKRLAQYYRDAEDAAKSYLDTLRLAQSRDLSGMGQGDRERNRVSGRAQIEDKYTQQTQDLNKSRRDSELNGTFGPDAQAKYDNELDRIKRFSAVALSEYDAYFAKRTEQEGNWAIGANEALSNYLSESSNIAAQSQQVFADAFKGMEDSLVSFITTGKLSFTSLADSIVADITRIIVKQQIANAATSIMSGGGGMGVIGSIIGAVSGSSGVASAASAMSGDSLDNMLKLTSNFAGRAGGGSVSAGSMYRVNEKGPELLQVAGKQYLMMGPQGGSVTPNDQISGGGGNVVNLTLHQNFPAGTSRATTTQAAAEASRQLSYAGRNL